MNLGEFIIKIGTKGDTKEIDKTIKRLESAEKKYRQFIKMQKELAKATTEEEKKQIKASYARQNQIDKLKETSQAQKNLNLSMIGAIKTGAALLGTIGGMVIALDRLGNSLLKNNQMYRTFNQQTGISTTRLNKMIGVAKLSGMNLPAEAVISDLQNLQQTIFELPYTGKNAGAFAMVGINPWGMDADKFIIQLREKLKGVNGQQKSFLLSQLGLSQEWLNVLNLADKDFQDFVALSSKLQLSQEERNRLTEYTLQQQKLNLQFEYAKQKLLLSVLPIIQQIMEKVSSIIVKVSGFFNEHPEWLNVIRDILLLLAGGAVFKTVKAIAGIGLGAFSGLFKNIGRFTKAIGAGSLQKLIGKQIAKKGLLATVGWAGGPVVSAILTIASGIWLIYDLVKPFFEKEDEKTGEAEPVDITSGGHYYKNINTNMTNNFHNNPQPVNEVQNSLFSVMRKYEASIAI